MHSCQENMTEPLTLRTIRSFVRRIGRLSPRQQFALTSLWERYGLVVDQGLLDLQAIFGRTAPCILEIGFGMGNSLVQQALQNPMIDYLGIEVHQPGIGNLMDLAAANNIANIRILRGDAVEILEKNLADESFAAIQIFFPDPWPKRKHIKRRLIQSAFVALLKQKLQLEGKLFLATDWEDYAKQMLAVLSANRGFTNLAGENQFAPRLEERPLTKFEQRGQRLGHQVWDLIFQKK